MPPDPASRSRDHNEQQLAASRPRHPHTATRQRFPHQLNKNSIKLKARSIQAPLLHSHSTSRKQKERPAAKMPTFAVPEDDASVLSDAGNEMDIDGESFEELADGITRAQQAQQQQNDASYHAHQQVTAQQTQAYTAQHFQTSQQVITPSAHQPTSSRARNLFTSPTHDQLMVGSHVPTSTGKRKRSESQPPARATYDPQPDTTDASAQRRIYGMIVTMYTITIGLIATAWSYASSWTRAALPQQQPQEQEIVAIVTDGSKRKRRAVACETAPSSSPSCTPTASNSRARAPAAETLDTSLNAPGAFPSPPDTSEERSFSPSMDHPTPLPKRNIRDTKKVSKDTESITHDPMPKSNVSETNKVFEDTGLSTHNTMSKSNIMEAKNVSEDTESSTYEPMPNLTEYTGIEPTKAEIYARFPGKAATHQDYAILREEKRQEQGKREYEELTAWCMRQDKRQRAAEEQFWAREDEAIEKAKRQAQYDALKVKFGEGWMKQQDRLGFEEAAHSIHHTLGKCGERCHYNLIHQTEGLIAHNYAKYVEADVKDMYGSKVSPEQQRAFAKTSAFKKFVVEQKKPQDQSDAFKKVQDYKKTKAERREQELAATSKAKGKKAVNFQTGAEAPKDESSRPTTSSSEHKPASYKAGLAPTPNRDQAGADPKKKWSYDKTMLPGKSVLKPKNHHLNKDRDVDNLCRKASKAFKVYVESPRGASGYLQWKEERNKRDREQWIERDKMYTRNRYISRANAEMDRSQAEQAVEETRKQWEQLRIQEQEQKEREEEEAARAAAAAEQLIKQKAIDEELARKAAEEQARLKQEKEAEEARKAEEAKRAAELAATHASKQALIRPLDPEWAEKVQKTMDRNDRNAVVATSMDGTELRRHDFGTLLPQEGSSDDPSGWLNDEVVNAFITAIVARKNEQAGYRKGPNNTPPYESYNSAWWTTREKSGIEGIKRWSRRKGIQGERLLKAEKIFLPINTGAHWQLLIIMPQQRCIEFLDSMAGRPEKYLRAAREWLAMELGPAYVAREWAEAHGRSGRQANINDCGVWVAMNALAAAKQHPFAAVTPAKMPDARRMVAAVLLNGGLCRDWEL